ncbi:hypothetical protein GOBAR_AA16472 [Gossypium barbadense]|uniref:RING-type domain-containing protein n=1 Tax=Gossypium barbadense TaxID=3634 RepID=A0A2P5XLH1_GOSBA|nr:hypothetical protein GOBAR_AA16472 [Gossypium barbadense]
MAVQAQYPSNVLFLNRGGQEEHEFSLQQQAGGVFLNQPHMLFNNGTNNNINPRKRAREVTEGAAITTPMNSYSLQMQPPQLIELSQLHQPNVGKELRRTLAEKRNRHYHALLAAVEESVARRLREKEAEVEKATRRNAELEACSAQLSVEVQVWQAKARAQEATATSLQAQLQQAMIGCGAAAVTQDSRRGEEGIEGQAEDAESAYVDPERMVSSGPSCKACRTRVASVVLLPCRHLCLCTECDRVAQACPLCLAVRNSSVEIRVRSILQFIYKTRNR